MVIAKVLDGFVDDSFMNEGIIPHSCPKCLQIFKRIVNPEFTISPKKLVISDIQKIGIVLFLKISKYLNISSSERERKASFSSVFLFFSPST